MSDGSTRSITLQAKPPEVLSALREAARRTGLQYLSGDANTGTVVFTSGRFLLGFGEKVTARLDPVSPGTVRVTLSSDPKAGFGGRRGGRADQLFETLSGLLPHA